MALGLAAQGRYRGDTEEIQERYRGDIGEIWGRCRGDVGEMWGRCRGDTVALGLAADHRLHRARARAGVRARASTRVGVKVEG